ncbi:hypothetical protein HMPREF1640_12245 [Prevotella sp. S7-1-8]|uniref:hypothetical protein n=1 Tax=Prevotellaceae TaxID=171552 RepID=UPI00050DE636|nr:MULTISPECIES: hypothetical protein [Prevotellaceae]KGF15389.1 hypothetical protein HMPREF1640_12245 [Prevotella sp. S7-1-8]
MKHEDFLQQYVAILQQEDRVLNEALRNLADKEYHWYADFPYVTAELSNCQGHLDAKVMAAKYPVTPHSGILIMPNEDNEYYEVGYNDLQFGDINGILDALPEGEE